MTGTLRLTYRAENSAGDKSHLWRKDEVEVECDPTLLYSRDSVGDSFVNALCLGLIIFRTAEVQVIPDTRRVDSSLIISIVDLH